MSEDLMDYQALVECAMKGVVRDILVRVAEDGLPGEHHLYITFRTGHKGVEIAERLAAQYPDEMTIVLQHQFWGLEMSKDAFEITLSFSGKSERLVIPFDAVIGFADPSVNFGLQFKSGLDDDRIEDAIVPQDRGVLDNGTDQASNGDNEDGEKSTGEVVALDAFRKNKT